MPTLQKRFFLAALLCAPGCAGTQDVQRDSLNPMFAQQIAAQVASGGMSEPSSGGQTSHKTAGTELPRAAVESKTVQTVSHEDRETVSNEAPPATLTINGKTYELSLVDAGENTGVDFKSRSDNGGGDSVQQSAQARVANLPSVPSFADLARAGALESEHTSNIESLHFESVAPAQLASVQSVNELPQSAESMTDTVEMNLPSVLAAINHQHPVVGFARWRVKQAYAELAQAEALWLPSIQAGMSFHRHDGNYQASNGSIVDVDRNSFQYGLGTGAVGAGTTPRPGFVAQFHLADAIFRPKVAQKTSWAQGHAASATQNQQLLSAGIAYLELLRAHQNQRIVEESVGRCSGLATITINFAEAGEGLQADADRLRTELALMENRLAAAQETTAVGAARLAQAISLDGSSEIVPMDTTVLPLELAADDSDKATLIATALAMRPELKESQALVAAACDAYQREKYAPFVPSVLLGFSTGGFGGGLGNTLDDVSSRYDFDALMSWEIRNLGLGERAARRQRSSQVQQAKYEKLRVMDQVAQDVSEAYAQVQFRRRQIELTRNAIETARKSYERNLERIRDGQGLPLEVLQSVQAYESAQRAHADAVVDYNQAQLRLQWAQGWPVSAG